MNPLCLLAGVWFTWDMDAANFLIFLAVLLGPPTLLIVACIFGLRKLESKTNQRATLAYPKIAVIGIAISAAWTALMWWGPVDSIHYNAPDILAPIGAFVVFAVLAYVVRRFSAILLAWWSAFLGFIVPTSAWFIETDPTGQSGVGIFMFIFGATVIGMGIFVMFALMSGIRSNPKKP